MYKFKILDREVNEHGSGYRYAIFDGQKNTTNYCWRAGDKSSINAHLTHAVKRMNKYLITSVKDGKNMQVNYNRDL